MRKSMLLMLVIVFALSACVTMGSDRTKLKPGVVRNNYGTIKKIVLQEAANNGFSKLTSEIKPSKYNNWKGKLYFSLKTLKGTDQLTVEFDGDSVKMLGAGTIANPDSAIKAIRARIDKLK